MKPLLFKTLKIMKDITSFFHIFKVWRVFFVFNSNSKLSNFLTLPICSISVKKIKKKILAFFNIKFGFVKIKIYEIMIFNVSLISNERAAG